MARTPYARMHLTTASKAFETAPDTHGRLQLSINENKQFNESQKQALKRRSSVLENDIGSVGPIRRIRQKPNLLHPKTLTLPGSGAPRAAHGSGPLLDVSELASSSGWSSHTHSLSKSMADNKPSTSSDYVPSQSVEMAQKIFQQLDKFTPPPKGKSSDLKIDIGGGNSPSKMTPALSGGSTHRSADTVDSLKILQSIQDNKKENGRMDSDAHVPLLKTPKTVEEASLKKFVVTTDNLASQNGAEGRVPASYSSHNTKITVVSHSGFDYPQKKRAFRMSAHEDYLELDDDVHLNGVASTPLGEGAGSDELLKKSAVIPDGLAPKEALAAEKPVVLEPKPSDSLLGKKEPQSLADGPVTTFKSVGFTFPVAPSTSTSNSMGTAAINVSKATVGSEKVAPQEEQNITVPAFKAKSDKLSPFAFSTSSAVESAVLDTRPELLNSADVTVAKANGPAETDKKSTQDVVDGLKKPEDTPSPVISSAKGIFNFGSPANNAFPTNALSSPIPTSVTSSSGLFSSISGDKRAAPVSPAPSTPLFSGSSGLSNGFAAPASISGTATAGTMVGTTTASSMPAFSASTSQISSSATVMSVSSGPTFQFGSSTSATFSTPASLSAENSGPKSVETTSSNSTSSFFSAKSPEKANGGTAISGFNASTFKASNGEAQTAAPASTGSVFGFQATSAAPPVSTSTPSFPSQSTSSASAPAFGLSTATNFSSGASVFGSVSPAASPFSSASSSSGVSSMSSSVSSGSGTTSSIFGSSWQPSKSTFPTTFGATSPSTGFSFGAAANGSSSDGSKSSVTFGSSTSNSSSSSSAPFVFGSATPSSSSSSSASSSSFVFGTAIPSSSGSSSTSSSPFVFGSSSSSSAAPVFSFSSPISTTTSSGAPSPSPPPSQPVFGNSTSTPAFAFGSTSTPTGNNDQMSMEDSMAEDSMQAPTATPAPVFGQSPISAPPSSGFVFGAAPSPAPAPGFMGAPSSANPFQFGSQPNQMPPQNPSPFQTSSSVEFHAGSAGSFSLGSGGGDKANRRIVKVKSKMRRK